MVLLNNQESYFINGGSTIQYFPLERGARQGDPVSAYLFILCLEILFILMNNDPNVKGLEIFHYSYLYIAHAEDTTFFLKGENSIFYLSQKFKLFSVSSGLKPNTTKYEVAGIGVLKGVQVAVFGT